MRYLKFIISLLVTVGLTYLFHNPINLSEQAIPPIMPALNPITGFWANAAAANNFKDETLNFAELKEEVKVVWDERLVPHIFAQNTEDALFAQGYITAAMRRFQMDLMQRDAAGTLAEIVGDVALPRDKLRRHQGVKWAAENAIEGWQESEDYVFIESYVSGVNAYESELSQKNLPLEFKILGYKPEKWSPVNTALVVKNMALSLCYRNFDIAATNTRKALGADKYDYFFPDYNPRTSPIIPSSKTWNIVDSLPAVSSDGYDAEIDYLTHRPIANPPENIGSNNWAISAEKSATGNPILCNDPHLNLSLPAIWFELQIHTPDFNAYGVSVPGIPGILIGFNENVAWGETNVGHDIVDWYQPEWVDEARNAYLFDGKTVPSTMREEIINIKGKAPLIDTVIYTHIGPVTYKENYGDLAMRWLAHDKPEDFEFSTFLNLMKAQNYQDYRAALQPYITPAQNFVFASKDNDIAITVNGKFPIKNKGDGRFVKKGNSSTKLWKEYISKDQVPSVLNPERGFVSSANQHSTDTTYPYYYYGGFADYRGRYLNRKLAEKDKFTIEDMKALQADNYSVRAEETVPILLNNINKEELNTFEKGLLAVLEKWNFRYDKEELAPVIFDEWWAIFYKTAWDEMQDDKITFQTPEYWRTIEFMETAPELSYWDIKGTPRLENLQDLLLLSFKEACNKHAEQLESPAYNYAQHQGFFINHLLRLAPFNRTNLNIGGTSNALNANKPGNGPSWRMIVELGDEVKALGVYPGGQSGNPASHWFDDMVNTWAEHEYYQIQFVKSPDDLKSDVVFQQTFK